MKTLLTILAMVIVTIVNAQDLNTRNVTIKSNTYDQNLRIMHSMREAGSALEQAGNSGNNILMLGIAGTSVGVIVLATSAVPGLGVAILVTTGVIILVATIIKNNKIKKAGKRLRSVR